MSGGDRLGDRCVVRQPPSGRWYWPVATFSAVRSSNRSARIAEAAFQVNLRPVLVTSRLDDPVQKIRWVDDHWIRLEGGQASVELVDGSIYLAISLRNVGPGLAVTFGWSIFTDLALNDVPHREPEAFRTQTRDLYIAPARHRLLAGRHPGAWTTRTTPNCAGTSAKPNRSPSTCSMATTKAGSGRSPASASTPFHVDDGAKWFPSVARHWNLDRPDPR